MSPTSGCSIPAESATKLAELALGAEGLSLEIQRRCVLDGTAQGLDQSRRFEMNCRRSMFHLIVWFTVLTGLASLDLPSSAWNPLPMNPAVLPVVGQALEGTTPFKGPENIIEQQYLQTYEYFSREIAVTPTR